MHRLSLSFALCLLLLAYSNLSKAALAGTLQDAIGRYDAGQYSMALQELSSIPKSAKDQDKIHWYKALCLQCLNQVLPAQQEYMWVFNNSQDIRLRMNSLVALQRLQRYAAHRTYQGQGNNFSRYSTAPPTYYAASSDYQQPIATGAG